MRKVIAFLFKTCLVLFLIGGTCLVLGQLTGIVFQNGDLIVKSWDVFSTPTFMISAIAGIFGFILGYFPKEELEKETVYSSDEFGKELKHVH